MNNKLFVRIKIFVYNLPMEYIKLQLGCLVVIFFVIFLYLREVGINKNRTNYSIFTSIYITAIVLIIFDALTSYTVNHLDIVSYNTNIIFHLCYYICIQMLVFLMFLYILSITDGIPPKIWQKVVISLPFAVSIVVCFFFTDELKFVQGSISNYSEGGSATACYLIVILYFILTVATFYRHWKYIEKRKLMTIFVYLCASTCVLIIQLFFPEVLMLSVVPVIFVLGVYLNHEEPAVKKLTDLNKNTIVDFATLVENRDNNTGGHIKRTTDYVKLLVDELRARKYFKDLLTKDFMNNLEMTAPLHDIGKIATPDAILQKPGKLTDEEYDEMKKHSENGAKIIKETFGKHGDEDFIKMAYEVALFHHEKWNGKGYPKGLKEDEIPLSARIMAIADVFDAISQKRCYRDAMPLDTCFEIIEKGKGVDFDPLLVDVFLEIRPKVEQVFNEI